MVREGRGRTISEVHRELGWGLGVWWRNQEMVGLSGAGVKGQPRKTGARWRLHSESGPASQSTTLQLGGSGPTVPAQHPGYTWLGGSRHGPHPCTCYPPLLDLSGAQDVCKGRGVQVRHCACEPWRLLHSSA